MTRTIFQILLTLVIFGSGFMLSRLLYQRAAEKKSIQTEIVLEKVKDVLKLVTVEGYFTEFYNYKNYYNYDWSIFRKKAMVRIKARVSMGVDLEKMKISVNEQDRTILISDIPPPSLVSIDHDLDYYDITEGTFNSFSSEDYNEINKGAKEYIEKVALQSELPAKASKRTDQALESIRILLESAGWKVEIKKASLPG